MRRSVDAVVIGAGLLGCSIGLELARRGMKTTVIDRHAEVGRGASRGVSPVFRCFYGTRPGVTLAHEGRTWFQGWREHLGNDSPLARFEAVGCALLLGDNDDTADDVTRLMRAAGIAVECLSGREAGAMVPGMRGAKTRVVFECGGGYLSSASMAAKDVRRAAEKVEVEFALGDRVVDIRHIGKRNGSRRVRGVTTAAGVRIDSRIVINAAGPHSFEVNLMAKAPLALTTVPMLHRMVRGEVDIPAGAPVIADLPGGHYVCFSPRGFQLGELHHPDAVSDYVASGDHKVPVPKSFLLERRRAFQKRHPGLRWHGAKVVTAHHDVTVLDRYPVVDRTDLNGYYVAIGTSGAWLKSAPALAWLMGELVDAVEAGRDHDEDPLKLILPRTRQAFDLGFLSRNRRAIRSELGATALS